MIFLLSPAKTLDMSPPPEGHALTEPVYKEAALQLADRLRLLSKPQLKKLLEVSDNLAALNHERYSAFENQPSKAAALAFNGDAYIGLDASSLSKEDLEWGQRHLRILSGLYGTLRPLDSMQPYRLNMGTKFQTADFKNLYEFWSEKVAAEVGRALEAERAEGAKEMILVNAASSEYFKAVKEDLLPAGTRVVEAVFRETNGRMLSVFCKKARGMLVRFGIQQRAETLDDLKGFSGASGEYKFRPGESSEDKLVFVRSPKAAARTPTQKKPAARQPEAGKAPEAQLRSAAVVGHLAVQEAVQAAVGAGARRTRGSTRAAKAKSALEAAADPNTPVPVENSRKKRQRSETAAGKAGGRTR